MQATQEPRCRPGPWPGCPHDQNGCRPRRCRGAPARAPGRSPYGSSGLLRSDAYRVAGGSTMSVLDPADPLLLAAGICALGAVLTAAIAFVVARKGLPSCD